MNYISTRGGKSVTAAQAIVQGISPEGGLYVPEKFPYFSIQSIGEMQNLSYQHIAYQVIREFLTEFTPSEIEKMIEAAYKNFDSEAVAPLVPLYEGEYMLELWHGPTLAFKDMALQILPYLMTASLEKTGEKRTVFILVATSGDTGKAALEGFKDVPGTKVMVFYPDGGVSAAQRLQMVTQQGNNVAVCAVKGNFDDAQTGVKRIFADDQLKAQIEQKGCRLSSANSINFGRLLPQIVYYFTSYATLLKRGEIKLGDKVNFCVPTGNFGDILAAYYAMRMGLPVNKLICASNSNNVLTDFFNTGVYDANRTLNLSMSCSIDILVSSNLERLLFEISGRDERTAGWMKELKSKGLYVLPKQLTDQLKQIFFGGFCDERTTTRLMRETFEKTNYLIDPHTAVAQYVYEQYKKNTGDTTVTVVASTASPFKFASHVLNAIEPGHGIQDEFSCADRLSEVAKVPVPFSIVELRRKSERFKTVCDLDKMGEKVLAQL